MTEGSKDQIDPPTGNVSAAEQAGATDRLAEVYAKLEREEMLEIKQADFVDNFADKEMEEGDKYDAKIAEIKKIETELLKGGFPKDGLVIRGYLFSSWFAAKLDYHGLPTDAVSTMIIQGKEDRSASSGSLTIYGKYGGKNVTLTFGPTLLPHERRKAALMFTTGFYGEKI